MAELRLLRSQLTKLEVGQVYKEGTLRRYRDTLTGSDTQVGGREEEGRQEEDEVERGRRREEEQRVRRASHTCIMP